MTNVLNIKQVAEVVMGSVFDNTDNLVIVEQSDELFKISGSYCGLWATITVRMNGPMVLIQANTIDDHNGYTVNFPIAPEDATAERINKHMNYILSGQ